MVNKTTLTIIDRNYNENGEPTKSTFISALRNLTALHKYKLSNVFVFEEIIMETIPKKVPGEISAWVCFNIT